jgi:flagellum-specific peptidoglycan hydrolase FlgJ
MNEQQVNNLKRIAAAAVLCEQDTGCPAELSAAQCILESGWLERDPGNNCFGIKATDRHPGVQYTLTKEYLNGEWETKRLAFEVYPTLVDCFSDHARLIKVGCYAPVWHRYQQDHDLPALIAGVASRYATDPAYAPKILKLAMGPLVTSAIIEARRTQPPPGQLPNASRRVLGTLPTVSVGDQ